MTLEEFSEVFALLAVQTRNTDADVATIRGFYVSLEDVELEFIAAAAERWQRANKWFPSTADWRQTAQAIESERMEQQRAILRKLPRPLCAACDDTGWSRDAADQVSRCECRHLRRLEVLGRRPMPALTEGRSDPTQYPRLVAMAKQAMR